MKNEKTRVVKTHDVQIDSNYILWLNEIKTRYRSAQIKAAVKVNAEQLLFNWQLGRDLVTRKAEERWGTGVVEQLSMDLQAAFPESKGFSTTNLWYMKQWYEFYSSQDATEKLQQFIGEIQTTDNKFITKLHQLGGEISESPIEPSEGAEYPSIFSFVPWRHHVEIISSCKSIDKALFYVKMTIWLHLAGRWIQRRSPRNRTRKTADSLSARTRNRLRIYGKAETVDYRRQNPQA